MARGRGRPTKLTPAVQDRICRALANNATRELASQIAGIKFWTFRYWLRRAEKQKRGIYADFSQAILQAESQSADKILEGITKAANEGEEEVTQIDRFNKEGEFMGCQVKTVRKKSLAAMMWIMERRHAADWARKESAEVARLEAEVAELRKAIKGDGK